MFERPSGTGNDLEDVDGTAGEQDAAEDVFQVLVRPSFRSNPTAQSTDVSPPLPLPRADGPQSPTLRRRWHLDGSDDRHPNGCASPRARQGSVPDLAVTPRGGTSLSPFLWFPYRAEN